MIEVFHLEKLSAYAMDTFNYTPAIFSVRSGYWLKFGVGKTLKGRRLSNFMSKQGHGCDCAIGWDCGETQGKSSPGDFQALKI